MTFKRKILTKLALLPGLLLIGTGTFAAGTFAANNSTPVMPVSELQQQVLDWANSGAHFASDAQRVEIAPAKMDSRLVFSRCSEPLAFEKQSNSRRASRTLVKVRCSGTEPWAVFVPLEVKRYQQVVVTRQPLLRDQPVTSADITLKEMAVNGAASGWYNSLETVEGMLARRNLRAGQALGEHDLKQAQLVKRGDEVVIVANTGSVTVKMRGTALANGYLNQQIEVRNSSSSRTIKAVVTDVGKVRALM